MRIKASRPTRRNDPTRATYSVLFDHVQTGLALRWTTKHAGVWRMPYAVCLTTHMLRRPRKGTGILGFLAGSRRMLSRRELCVCAVFLVELCKVN